VHDDSSWYDAKNCSSGPSAD